MIHFISMVHRFKSLEINPRYQLVVLLTELFWVKCVNLIITDDEARAISFTYIFADIDNFRRIVCTATSL